MRVGLDVSVLCDLQKTGIAVYTFNLVDTLIKQNRDTEFVLLAVSPVELGNNLGVSYFKKYPNVRLKIYRIPLRLLRLFFINWQKFGVPPIESLIGRVDIFHSFNWFLPPQKKGKTVSTVFDVTSIKFPQWHIDRTTQLDKLRFQRISKKADLVLAISENTKKDFLKLYPDNRVEVIYPAVSNNFGDVDKKTVNTILRKYYLKEGYFLSVATLEPRKNIPFLVEAFLKGEFPNQLALIGGKGWKSNQITEAVSKNPGKIKVLGFVPEGDLPALYKAALCLVYPSLYEGFGIPVLEAMSCGTPVISSNRSSLPEVGGAAALFIDPEKEDELIKAMKRVFSDKSLQMTMSQKGRSESTKFSWERSAKKLMSFYKELVEKK